MAYPPPALNPEASEYAWLGLYDETWLSTGATKLFTVTERCDPYIMTRRSVQDALLATNNVREFFIVAAAAQGNEMDPGPGFQPLFPPVENFAAGNTLDLVRPTEMDFVNAGYIYGFAAPDPSTQPITLLAQGLVTVETYAYVWMYFQQPYDNAEALAAAAAAAKKGGAPAAKTSPANKA